MVIRAGSQYGLGQDMVISPNPKTSPLTKPAAGPNPNDYA